MLRLLHVIAISALVASAVYAYSIKYDSTYFAEQVAKLKLRTQRERDSIAVLKAEWQRLVRPDRLQAFSDRHLDLQPLSVQQIVRASDLPMRQARSDEIGKKLEALGLSMPTDTPRDPAAGGRGSTSTTSTGAKR